MPLYKCEIIDKDGKRRIVRLEALSEITLNATIRMNQSYLIKATQIKEKKENTFFAVSSKVKPIEVILFLRQFSVMISAGDTISDSLESLKNQKHSKVFKRVLQDVHDDVLSGVLLSNALSKHPKVFPEYFQNMVAIGESSGNLDKVLESLASYYENDRKIKSKAKTALVYPTFLLALIIIIVFFMTLFIIPQFEDMINELGGEVPLITQIILNISNFIRKYILFIILGILILTFLTILFFKTKKGKYFKDYMKLKLPFLGTIQKELTTSRFSNAFIILLSSGMNITDCMLNLKRMLGSMVLKKKFEEVIISISKGVSISKALSKMNFFPEILIDMIDVGEKSGNLESVLKSTSGYFQERVDSAITKATAALEPIMIIFLGVIVGVVILAVFLPIISLMQSI